VLHVTIDLDSLRHLADIDVIQKIGDKAAADLALLTQAKVNELAGERLHSRLEMFRKGLSLKQESDGIWLIHLESELTWIEDGAPARSMIPDFMNSPHAKTASDGSRYLVIPFTHTAGKGGATQNTPAQQILVDAVRKQLKQQGIAWGKIEKDSAGRPKLGKLHQLNLTTPNKPHDSKSGRGRSGFGWGGAGSPMVGATGIGFLEGAQVFQTLNSSGKVERGVTTFRVASSKHEAQGRWQFPGIEPAHILNDAYEWAIQELDRNIMPDIIRQIEALSK
jgi:hypothetical protein